MTYYICYLMVLILSCILSIFSVVFIVGWCCSILYIFLSTSIMQGRILDYLHKYYQQVLLYALVIFGVSVLLGTSWRELTHSVLGRQVLIFQDSRTQHSRTQHSQYSPLFWEVFSLKLAHEILGSATQLSGHGLQRFRETNHLSDWRYCL